MGNYSKHLSKVKKPQQMITVYKYLKYDKLEYAIYVPHVDFLAKRKTEKTNIYRLAATTSASSKNIMLGAARRALRNVLRNNASPSPTYIE